MTTAKKINKRQSLKMDPRIPLIFCKFLLFLPYTYLSNSLTIQAKFHEVPKYIVLYSKMELLKTWLKIKKIPLKNYVIKTIFFQRHSKIFD